MKIENKLLSNLVDVNLSEIPFSNILLSHEKIDLSLITNTSDTPSIHKPKCH